MRKFSITRFVGFFGALTVITLVLHSGGSSEMFFHIPSLAITLGVAFFLLLGTYGEDFLKFIPDSIRTLVSVSPNPNPKFAEIAKFGSRYVVAAGLIGG